jgi:hypothetical protein
MAQQAFVSHLTILVLSVLGTCASIALFGIPVIIVLQLLSLGEGLTQALPPVCLTLGQKGFLQGFEEGRRRSDKNHIDRTGGFVLSRQKRTPLAGADVAQTVEESPGERP